MSKFALIPDRAAGSAARGRIRYERRQPIEPTDAPPLVILGGMTQTISSWGGQLRPLAADRQVIVYEARGQGSTELRLTDCSPKRHVQDFAALLEALELTTPVDLCGFSFGGRVCVAIAASQPQLVRRLVLSGVGFDRGVVGKLIISGWQAALGTGNLEALARISLPDILGPSYLERNESLIDSMIRTAVARNRYDGIKALFEQTMAIDPESPWALGQLLPRLRCKTLVMGGALDRIAPPDEVTALAQRLGAEHRVFPDAGHTIPIEAAGPWREAVQEFLAAS